MYEWIARPGAQKTTATDTVTQATYYDYDLDGNVKNLYQQIQSLGIKRINYEYDLISGKVNFVAYQNGKPDQFYYQYNYDADNRITEAWTSIKADTSTYGFGSTLDSATQKLDASYQYYLHGPLARMELGDVSTKVQGVDYAYTLQGWLKGVNSQILNAALDMGQDSATVAKDAYGYSLGYYTNDYKPIGGTTYTAFANQYTQNTGDITGQSLYNGNISTSTYAISQINSNNPVGYTYHYDQLNRIKHLRQHSSITSWSHSNINSGYSEDFTFDGNGNILSLLRSGTTSATKDSLIYKYNLSAGRLTNNQLNWLGGHGAATNMGTDQAANNYKYDPIGNLTDDAQSHIDSIHWSVYGKIMDMLDSTKTISYLYNTAQERVAKTANGLTTYYIRDAQGNTLSLYDNKASQINWREQHLYGSSRLGMWQPNVNLVTNNAATVWDTIGKKSYELNNHLGNVVVTISDSRTSNTGYFTANVKTAQDYYAFGALMPSRTFTSNGSYRYGFNGKENDNEVKGTGNQQNYGMRIYDPRVGRFLSVDPISTSYSWSSPYEFAENEPIWAIDLDGLEKYTIHQSSFAPFAYFGDILPAQKPYKGDGNRGFNILPESEKNTSRIYSITKIDLTTAKQIGNTLVRSFPSIGPRNFYGENGSTTAHPEESTKVERQFGDVNVSINFNGHDARIDGILAPDINWTGEYIFDTQTKGVLEIKASMIGKGFPAYQQYIEDANGKKIMLNTFAPSSKEHIFNLMSSPDVYRGGSYMKIGVNSQGNFTGNLMIYERVPFKGTLWEGLTGEIQYQWNKYTIDEWNKKQSNKPAAGGNSN